jgi:hypothetical protein
MAMGQGILDFVQRFRALQMQTHSRDDLIQDLLVYAEGVESKLRTENQNLISQLRDAELDLTDATKSRRELQQQLQLSENQSNILLQENAHLKNHNPYVLVLIDGDGLLVRCPLYASRRRANAHLAAPCLSSPKVISDRELKAGNEQPMLCAPPFFNNVASMPPALR